MAMVLGSWKVYGEEKKEGKEGRQEKEEVTFHSIKILIS